MLLGVTPDGRLFGEDVEGRRFEIPHPLLGRRVRSFHLAQDGTIEKVEPTRRGYDIIRIVWDDGTRSTETAQGDTILDVELLPEPEGKRLMTATALRV